MFVNQFANGRSELLHPQNDQEPCQSARMPCKPIWVWHIHVPINKKFIRTAVGPPQAEIFYNFQLLSYVFLIKKTFLHKTILFFTHSETFKNEVFSPPQANFFLISDRIYKKAPPLFVPDLEQGGAFLIIIELISACARGRTDGKLRTYVPRREMAFLENHYVPRRKWSYCIPMIYRVSDTGIIGFTVAYSHTIFECHSIRGMCNSRIP